MKTPSIFLLLLVSSLNVFSQNITNTLGTSGVFKIKDGSTDYMTLNQSTGQVNILKTLRLENTTSSTTGIIFKGADRFIHNYGLNNTFTGINSGNFTMTGYSNTAFGQSCLISTTYGYNNTAMGTFALALNIGGYDNTALGTASLYSNSYGADNTAVGTTSLYSNTNGSYNTAVGWSSLYYNIGGDYNTAVGKNSLFLNTEGNYNTALGSMSLYANLGNYNTGVGFGSLYYNIGGNRNTAMGMNSLLNNVSGNNNTAVGSESLPWSTGNENTALGSLAGQNIGTGSNVMCLGFYSQPSSSTVSNQITLGNTFISSLRCAVTTITSLSDARDKKNIEDLSLGINFLMKLKPRLYNWDKREWYDDNVSDGSKMQESPTAGFIAQELDEVQTSENAGWLNLVLKDNPEKWEATPGNLLPIMVKAIQELKTENDELKTENDELKERLSGLEQMQNLLALEMNKIKSNDIEVKKVKLGER